MSLRITRAAPSWLLLSAALSFVACEGPVTGTTSGGRTAGSATGGSAPTTTGGSTRGTTTGAAPSCATGWTPCTPANICDLGCSPDGGLCIDQLAADRAQTGALCDGGACEGTLCLSPGPQVPNQGGGVIAHPNIVIMTYADDSDRASIESWAVWIADGGFLPATAGQYGIGNGTVAFVHLTDAAPDSSAVYEYVLGHAINDPHTPFLGVNNFYMLFLPDSWPDTSTFCQTEGGYHEGSSPFNFAVIPNCRSDLRTVEVAASHEIVEGTTDPWSNSWTLYGTGNPWTYLGGEVGDLCASLSSDFVDPNNEFAGQYIWSNSAAAAGQVPCQPWPAGAPYVGLVGPSAVVPAAPGSVANIPVTGWANEPVDDWAVVAYEADYGVDFATNPSVASDTIRPGEQVMAQLNIPPAEPGQFAEGGFIGAGWILAATANGDYGGATMVAAVVTCDTTSDCANESSECVVDGGIGLCQAALCPQGATDYGTCSAQGTDDGFCLPMPSWIGTGQWCTQAGSAPIGAACDPYRVVGGTPDDYCVPSAYCAGSQTPTCLQLCARDSDCSGSQVCYETYYYSVCTDPCSKGGVCASGFSCASNDTGSGCFPN